VARKYCETYIGSHYLAIGGMTKKCRRQPVNGCWLRRLAEKIGLNGQQLLVI